MAATPGESLPCWGSVSLTTDVLFSREDLTLRLSRSLEMKVNRTSHL